MISARGWATAAVFCVLATSGALAQKAASPDPAGPSKSWPRLLPGKAEAAPAATWSRAELDLAQARCSALLKTLNVVAVPEVPLREGAECGTPAPMKLISVGRNPQVALMPPPIVTCDMIAAMHKWLERDVQPLARKHLGAPVVRIETMSSYSCRNAYGRANGRLSEHGRANAIDIGAFITAKSQATMVVADWGPTVREIQAAAAKGEAERPTAAPAHTPPPTRAIAEGTTLRPTLSAPPAALGFQPGFAFSIPGLTIDVTGTSDNAHGFTLMPQPSRLGGPKTANAPAAALIPGNKMDFLRGAHQAACKIFGTVLGPEANNAHKNHFHVDMAERRAATVICE